MIYLLNPSGIVFLLEMSTYMTPMFKIRTEFAQGDIITGSICL